MNMFVRVCTCMSCAYFLCFLLCEGYFATLNRLAGVTLLAPVVNYWWPGFPTNLSTDAFYKQLPSDQWALRIAHYVPWLTHWWNTQKWFPGSSVAAQKPYISSRQDKELLPKIIEGKTNEVTFSPYSKFCIINLLLYGG